MNEVVSGIVRRRMASALNRFVADNPLPRSADAIAVLERLVSEFAADIKSAANADGITLDSAVLQDVEQLTSHIKEGTDHMRFSPAPRHRRDDLYVDPYLAPSSADATLDPAIADVVASATVVEPVKKRYRATITRTITESAIVEFDAMETEDLNAVANALVQSLPPESWVDNAASDWGWIDRIEEVAAAPAEPAALEMLDSEKVPIEEEDDAPVTLGSGRRIRVVSGRGSRGLKTRRFMRMAAADAMTAAEEITNELDALTSGQDLSDPAMLDAYITSLNALATEVSDALAVPIEDDGVGDAAMATDALNALATTIDELLTTAIDAQSAASSDPAF